MAGRQWDRLKHDCGVHSPSEIELAESEVVSNRLTPAARKSVPTSSCGGSPTAASKSCHPFCSLCSAEATLLQVVPSVAVLSPSSDAPQPSAARLQLHQDELM